MLLDRHLGRHELLAADEHRRAVELRQQAGYEPICMRAEQRIEAFHIRQLATSRASGAKYALGCKFGWNDAAPKESGARVEFENAMQDMAR